MYMYACIKISPSTIPLLPLTDSFYFLLVHFILIVCLCLGNALPCYIYVFIHIYIDVYEYVCMHRG